MNTRYVIGYVPPQGPADIELGERLFKPTRGGGQPAIWWRLYGGNWRCDLPTSGLAERALILHDPTDPHAGPLGRFCLNEVFRTADSEYICAHAWKGDPSLLTPDHFSEWITYFVQFFDGRVVYIAPSGQEVQP